MNARRFARVAFLALCAASAACSAILGLEPPPGDDGGVDASSDTTTGGDGSGDATTDTAADGQGPQADGGTDAAGDGATCLPITAGDGSVAYSPLQNLTLPEGGTSWTFYAMSNVSPLSQDFQGVTFDSRYVYFAPYSNGTITRYDTQGGFQTRAAWSTFDTTTLSPLAEGFSGALFDGHYAYFVPYRASGTYTGIVVRYDTTTSVPFGTPGPEWSIFDLTTLSVPDAGTLVGFSGGVFDGRGIYLAPNSDSTGRTSRVVRYATDGGATAEPGSDAAPDAPHDAGDAGSPLDAGEAGPPVFASASDFSVYDLTQTTPSASGYIGAAFDGRYDYMVPWDNGGLSGLVARYDSTGQFTAGASWSVFDTTAINSSALGFAGAAFDGRYLYLVPHNKTVMARFDTQSASLGTLSAWSTFDLATLIPSDAGAPGFSGGAYDGRFVYAIPSTLGTTPSGVVTRYDTWSTFTSPCAWSTFDISTVNASATEFFGAVFDGQYLYLVPKNTGSNAWVARFQTKTAKSMPVLPSFSGSFF